MNATELIKKRVATVSAVLGPTLLERVVLVGGSSPAFYDVRGAKLRPTKDVDIVVMAESFSDLEEWKEKARQRGMRDVPNDEFLGRMEVHGVAVDLLSSPYTGGVSEVGWFGHALARRRPVESLAIQVVEPPVFLACKWQAFGNRGASSPRDSPDLEDIVAVFAFLEQDLRGLLLDERAPERFVRRSCRNFARREDALELIQGHLPGDAASQGRADAVLELWSQLS